MIRIHNFRCSTICKINKIEIKQLSKNKKIIELELYRKYINKLLLKKDKEKIFQIELNV